MSNRLTTIIAALFLIFVFFITVFSMKDDSLTMDELAHLPAGYSYLTKKDMRLNPEHPPLIKDLAALPLLFIQGIEFPENIKAWKEDINGQWDFGHYFLYEMKNPTEKMIFFSRIPMVLILILLGFYVFKWARELFGNKTALLALFLFSFSPTLLTHGRLVTTDVGAATGFFIATYYFIKALKDPSKRNIILAGISFGLAELSKFSTILLVPFFVFLGVFWIISKSGNVKKTSKVFFLTMVLGLVLILLIYQYHVLNYPPERQVRDIEFLLGSGLFRFLRPLLSKLAKVPVLRALAQYLFGLSMVFERATGGHTTYFLGQVSATGWKNYFPIVYIIKEPLVFHILTLISLLFSALAIKKPFFKDSKKRLLNWVKENFVLFAAFSFLFLYWAFSLSSSLNIGVRHLLPVFPFTIILVSRGIMKWLRDPRLRLKQGLLALLILWQTISVIGIYPHFLAYFNEVAGGPNKGYVYTVNSNLDWGQDLKRLKKWVDLNNIEEIYVDYFGGSDPKFHLKEKYKEWSGARDPREIEKGSYLAVSATFYQGGRGRPVKGFDQSHSHYLWLSEKDLVKKIGYSIFIFYIH